MNLEKERRIRPPGEDIFLIEGGVLRDLLYDEDIILIPEGCKEIGTAAFINNLYIEQMSLPATVHTIEPAAFSGCMYLRCVHFQEGLKVIGEDAFYLCSCLTEVSLPSTLCKLGQGCFQDTKLKSVRVPGHIGTIPKDAFADNFALETVWLEEGITHIESGAFQNCPQLRDIYCPGSLKSIADNAFENTPVKTVAAPGEWLIYRQDLVDRIMK